MDFAPAQYSAASFIETVNATSLTIEPDEFVAHMIAAGIPDMQLAPLSQNATPKSHPAKPPAFVTDQAVQQLAALAEPELAQEVFQAPSLAQGISTVPARAQPLADSQPPTGAPLPALDPSISRAAFRSMNEVLPTHSAAVAGGQLAVPDAATQLPGAATLQHVAPAVPEAGATALASPAAQAADHDGWDVQMQQHQLQQQAASSGWSRQYPSVQALEKAGVPLMLATEAGGHLQQQYRYLYADAGDLRIFDDVKELLSSYKVRALHALNTLPKE